MNEFMYGGPTGLVGRVVTVSTSAAWKPGATAGVVNGPDSFGFYEVGFFDGADNRLYHETFLVPEEFPTVESAIASGSDHVGEAVESAPDETPVTSGYTDLEIDAMIRDAIATYREFSGDGPPYPPYVDHAVLDAFEFMDAERERKARTVTVAITFDSLQGLEQIGLFMKHATENTGFGIESFTVIV